jgi:hypothetical protein
MGCEKNPSIKGHCPVRPGYAATRSLSPRMTSYSLSVSRTRHIGLLTEQPSFQLVRMPSLLH